LSVTHSPKEYWLHLSQQKARLSNIISHPAKTKNHQIDRKSSFTYTSLDSEVVLMQYRSFQQYKNQKNAQPALPNHAQRDP